MARRIAYLVWYWLPVALWLLVIAIESTDLMSARNTGSVLYIALAAIVGPVDPDRFAILHFVLRKAGHFTGYGILSFLFFRALDILQPLDRLSRGLEIAYVHTLMFSAQARLHSQKRNGTQQGRGTTNSNQRACLP